MLALTSALLLPPLAAHAQTQGGSYVWSHTVNGVTTQSPVYSGGTASVPYGDGTIKNYNDGYSKSGDGSWGFGGVEAYFTSTTEVSKASGAISVAYKWDNGGNAANLAPTAVIITEIASDSASASNGSGLCDDNMGHTGASVSATLYSGITNPGNNILLGRSPTATATNVGSSGYGGSFVSYKTAVSPITVNLGGATYDSSGNANILVGQGCTASLSGIPSGGGWTTTYQWSVSGATFQSWNGDSGTVPVVAILGIGTANQATAHWFWSDTAGSKSVACTAIITPPTGQGSQFKVTIKKSVALQVPTSTASNLGGLGYVAAYVTQMSQSALEALPTPSMQSNGFLEGSSWRTKVVIPPLFTSSGQFAYAQIITPGDYLTADDGTVYGDPDNGQQELDGSFPYLGYFYNADGRPYNDGDSPKLPVADFIASAKMSHTCKTYLMFKPSAGPGAPNSNDAQWVPLKESDWHTDIGAGRPASGHWSDFPASQAAGYVYIDADFTPQTVHPYWTQVGVLR